MPFSCPLLLYFYYKVVQYFNVQFQSILKLPLIYISQHKYVVITPVKPPQKDVQLEEEQQLAFAIIFKSSLPSQTVWILPMFSVFLWLLLLHWLYSIVLVFRPVSLGEPVTAETVSVASCVESGIAARTHLATALDLDSTTSERHYTAEGGINSAARFTIRGELVREVSKTVKQDKRMLFCYISTLVVLLIFPTYSFLLMAYCRPSCPCCVYVLCKVSSAAFDIDSILFHKFTFA